MNQDNRPGREPGEEDDVTAATMPAGFTPVEAPPTGHAAEKVFSPDSFRRGVKTYYRGSRLVTTRSQGDRRLHLVSQGLGEGKPLFGIWGSLELDQQLRKVPEKTLVFIQYMGKVEHPRDPEKTVHKWAVGVPSSPAARGRQVEELPELEEFPTELEA